MGRFGAGGRFLPALGWLIPAIAIISTCGWLGLIEPTETRYAEIAREMLASGNWLTPHLNGIPHFHKPPIAYWAAAAGMAAFGVNEWGARLGVALAAAFVLWCTARIGRVVAGGAGAAVASGADGADSATTSGAADSAATLAPLLLASTALFFALSRQLASDIFLAAAVAGFYAAYLDPARRRGLLPFVALGLGFMAKGPVVLILTVAPVLLAAWFSRDRSAAKPLARWRGWLVFGAVALPWYLVVVAQTPGLLSYFLQRQIWERYTTTVHQRGGPIYYFVGVVLLGALPWAWAAMREGWHAARGEGERGEAPATAATFTRRRPPAFENALLAAWVVVPTVFFSFSGSKLPAYVLPVFPAVAVLAARTFMEPQRGTALAAAIPLLLAAAGAEWWAIFIGGWGAPFASVVALHVAAAALVAAGVASVRRRVPLGAALALLGLFTALWWARPFDFEDSRPSKSLAQALRTSRQPGEPVVEYANFNAGIPFYLREEIPMLEVPRDLGFEDIATHGHALIDRGALVRMTETHDRVWVVGEGGAIEKLANSLGLRATKVTGLGKRTLVIVSRPG